MIAAPFRLPLGRFAARLPDATTLRFLVTGGGAALLFFALSYAAARAHVPPFGGTLGAYAICFVAAYLTQRAWTFGGTRRHRDALPRYLAAQLCSGLLSAGLARILAEAGGLPPLPRAALVTLASSALSFMLSRYWVFAER